MRKTGLLIFGSGAFLLLFLVFSYLVKSDIFTQVDFDTTVRIQDQLPRALDPIFNALSFTARFEVLTFSLVLILLMRRHLSGFLVFFVYGLGHIVIYLSKVMITQLGPPFLFYRASELQLFRDYVDPGFSYPSGHTYRAIFMVVLVSSMIIASKLPTKLKFGLTGAFWTIGISVGLTKIALGQHWPTDIIGGGLLGAGLALLSVTIMIYDTRRSKNSLR